MTVILLDLAVLIPAQADKGTPLHWNAHPNLSCSHTPLRGDSRRSCEQNSAVRMWGKVAGNKEADRTEGTEAHHNVWGDSQQSLHLCSTGQRSSHSLQPSNVCWTGECLSGSQPRSRQLCLPQPAASRLSPSAASVHLASSLGFRHYTLPLR